MTEFNISNSKIEQLNDHGDNVKVAGNSAPVVVAGSEAAQATGENNQLRIAPKNQPSLAAVIVKVVKRAWMWIFGSS